VTLGSRCMVHGLVGFLAVIGLLAVSPNASCMSARLPFFLQSQYFSEWDKAKSALVTFHSAYLVICQVYFVYFTPLYWYRHIAFYWSNYILPSIFQRVNLTKLGTPALQKYWKHFNLVSSLPVYAIHPINSELTNEPCFSISIPLVCCSLHLKL
jgi:hypothetical protein